MRLRTPRSWAALAAASLALALTVTSGAYAAAPASPASGSGAVSAADTTPPSKPTGLYDRCSTDYKGVLFCWQPSTDDVGVVGYDVYRQSATGYVQVGSSTATIFDDQDVVTGTSYTYIVIARDAAGNQSAPSDPLVALARNDFPTPTPTPTPTPPSLACHVTYEFVAWRTGQNAWITLKNTGTAPIDGWTLSIRWQEPAPRLTSGHSAVWSRTDSFFTARNLAWNKVIAPGASVRLGFTAAHTGATPVPLYYGVNGVYCSSTYGPRR
ncbi:cellulose binding domain-containing protein [Sphaerisporangium sp. NPDC005289]|uniref:cellulose binding domain-containing protein n=1 Tax=Sphaerisporangium sp. NPDC005289 TaxID=3155247 RepID=UPI0033A3531C